MLDTLQSLMLDSPERLRARRRAGAGNTVAHSIETIVAMVAHLLGTPVAMISLTEAAQPWFRSVHGRNADSISLTTPLLPVSPLAEFNVTDMQATDYFARTGLAAPEFGLHACAGTLLVEEFGAVIGLLCVADERPRVFTGVERGLLAELGRAVAVLLPLHGVSSLVNLTATDSLTGLPNLALFSRQGQAAIKAMQETMAGGVCGVLRIDLDRCSNLNQLYGHDDGELLLRRAAARISTTLREVDFVARIGADQFAVLLPGMRQPQDADYVAARIVEALLQTLEIDDRPLRIPASIGIAISPDDGTDIAVLLERADMAVSQVRRDTMGSVGRFIPAVDRKRDDPASFEQDLRTALAQDRLQTNWQPVLRCADGELVGLESLTRWNRVGYGRISPARFIAVAERIGMAEVIDRWALIQACRAAVAWPERLRACVSLSAAWFHGERPVEMVTACLAETGLDPGLLQIEVTEAVFASVVPGGMGGSGWHHRARQVLDRLRDMGVRVALDGFGTGVISLRQASAFAFDQVKLDAVFIEALGLNRRVDTVLTSLLKVAKNLGISVCAKGVVREGQLTRLQELGCDEIQGYLVGRPVPLTNGQLNRCRAPGSARLFRPRMAARSKPSFYTENIARG